MLLRVWGLVQWICATLTRQGTSRWPLRGSGVHALMRLQLPDAALARDRCCWNHEIGAQSRVMFAPLQALGLHQAGRRISSDLKSVAHAGSIAL